jgi:tRNA threonylcarbamoyladenosine biosynthesis protein TsaB
VRVLALDAATEASSVALLSSATASPRGAQIIGRHAAPGKSHSQQILQMVDAVLAEAQISLAMLDGIAASVGPGAFTGVRISVAVAQGLAFGAGLRVVPVTTLEALALQAVQGGATHALACLDARMGEVYWECFAADAARGVIAVTQPWVGPPDTVRLPDSVPVADSVPPPATRMPAEAGRDPGIVRYRGIGRGFAAYPALAAIQGLDLDPADTQALPDARAMAQARRACDWPRAGGWIPRI